MSEMHEGDVTHVIKGLDCPSCGRAILPGDVVHAKDGEPLMHAGCSLDAVSPAWAPEEEAGWSTPPDESAD